MPYDLNKWSAKTVAGALVALYEKGHLSPGNSQGSILIEFAKLLKQRRFLTAIQVEAIRSRLPKYSVALANLDWSDFEMTVSENRAQTFRLLNPKKIKIDVDPGSIGFEHVKRLTGLEFNAEINAYVCEASRRNAFVLENSGFKTNDRTAEWMKGGPDKINPVEIKGLLKTLRPFQVEGVSFICNKNGRAILADEQGLGKTIQGIAFTQQPQDLKRTLIVCPASVKLNWVMEIKDWTGEDKVFFIFGKTVTQRSVKKLSESRYAIINYSLLQSWRKALQEQNFDCVIFDEAQAIKPSRVDLRIASQRALSAKEISKTTKYILAMSGTPLENGPAELFPLIQMIDPALFSNRLQFAQKFCGLTTNSLGDLSSRGASNTKELNHLLINTMMIRRKKSDVLADLPPKTRAVVPVSLNKQDMAEYYKMENDFARWLKEFSPSRFHRAAKAQALVKVNYLKQFVAKAKLPMIFDWLETFLETGNKLVVFGVHTAIIRAICDRHRSISVFVDGSVSSEKRQKLRDQFQSDDAIKLFIASLEAAGTGITLTAAKDTFTSELAWKSTTHDQAEDRVHRIGQTEAVTAYYMIAENTIETRISALLDRKRAVVESVLDGTDPVDDTLFMELLRSYNRGL